MKLTFKIVNLHEFTTAMQALTAADGRQAMVKAEMAELQRMTESSFRSERYRPAPWPPLKASTVKMFSHARKREANKRKGRISPLIDNAVLVRSFIYEAGPDGSWLASDTDYAKYHQWGTRKMPARPFVPVTGDWGREQVPTPVAATNLLKASRTALRIAAQRAGLKTGR